MSDINFTFRVVSIEDEHIPSFQRAVAEVSAERLFLATFEGFSVESTRQFVESNRAKGMPNLVAVCGDTVIGWCDVSSYDKITMRHCGVLGMGVLQAYRGKGVGKALITMALEAANAAGLTRVELIVRDGNAAAVALYKAVGFQLEGVQRRACLVDGVYFDHIMMAVLFDR
jgi:RimJ/RimL family protein N-acetyltransferase